MGKITKISATSKHKLRLRVYAIGNDRGWYFKIDQDQRPVAADFGPLPVGYKFNNETATHYALAQAARYIERHLPAARVVCVCTVARRAAFNTGRRAAA